jgi:hypothetical protein
VSQNESTVKTITIVLSNKEPESVMLHTGQNESYRRDNNRGSTQGSPSRTMSHESRLLAVRAQYQSESVGYSRFSFSKALHSAISLPHVFDQSFQLALPVGEGTSGDTSLPLGRCSAIDTNSTSVAMASSELSDGGLE